VKGAVQEEKSKPGHEGQGKGEGDYGMQDGEKPVPDKVEKTHLTQNQQRHVPDEKV
jgi:hypothetical protein